MWHGRPICRVIKDAIVVHLWRPVSLEIGPPNSKSPMPPPRTILHPCARYIICLPCSLPYLKRHTRKHW